MLKKFDQIVSFKLLLCILEFELVTGNLFVLKEFGKDFQSVLKQHSSSKKCLTPRKVGKCYLPLIFKQFLTSLSIQCHK